MSTDLCGIWKELVTHPGDPGAAATARAHLTDLIAHVDECDACRRVTESMDEEAEVAVFAVLGEGGLPLAEDEREILAKMDNLVAHDRRTIDAAVDYLLAGLPPGLGTLEQIVAGDTSVTSQQLFLAIDSVNLLVRSHGSRHRHLPLRLSKAGLRVGNAMASSGELIVSEIGRHANVIRSTAEALWAWQLQVAERCPTLYRGLQISSVVDGALELTIIPSTTSDDLTRRWQIPTAPVGDEADVEALVSELVTAMSRCDVALAHVSARRSDEVSARSFYTLVERIQRDNSRLQTAIVKSFNVAPSISRASADDSDERVVTVGYAQSPGAGVPYGEQAGVAVSNLAQQCRRFERRKNYYLRRLAASPGAIQTASDLKQVIRSSRIRSETHIEELGRFVMLSG